LVYRELWLPGEPVAQRFAFDVGHGIVEDFSRCPGIEEAENVGVLEASREPDFLEERSAPSTPATSGRSTLSATCRSCLRSRAR
jgi:hypothetical protein